MNKIYAQLLGSLAFSMTATLATADESVAYRNLVTPLLETSADIIGQPVAYAAGPAKVSAVVVTIPPGGETNWHVHEVPLFIHVLEGEVTVDYGAKGIKVYKAGASFMEAMNWAHNGMNKSGAPVRMLAVYMGAGGKMNAGAAPAPKQEGR